MTQEKEGKWNIDIGASVGDTLAAIWNYTDDFVLCIEPVKKFFAAVLGAAVGMLIYVATLGRFFVRFSYAVIDKTIGSFLRLLKKILRRLKKLFRPVKNAIVKMHDKKILFYQKCRLTGKTFRHNIIMCRGKKTQKRKGETNHGKAKKEKGKKKKNAGVPPHQK